MEVVPAKRGVGRGGRGRGSGRGRGRGGRRRIEEVEDGLEWQDIEVEDYLPQQPGFRPTRVPGPQVITGANYTILDLFLLFISETVLQSVLINTNALGRRRHGAANWEELNMADMFSYLSLIIYMGLVRAPALTDYWRKSKLYSFPFPASVMSGRKFTKISTNIHLSDPEEDEVNEAKKGTPDYDRLHKIRPMYDEIRQNCMAHFQPGQNIAVDERMVASRARIGIRQYMKDKPVKWGFKLFVLADSSCGYTWDFFVYRGKGHIGSGRGLSYDVVMELVSSPVLGTGYKLFVDNFYTSPMLFRDLLADKKIWACGTIREQRVGFPKHRAGTLNSRDPRGTIRWIREGPLVFVQWKDTRVVQMYSSIHKAHSGDTVQRRVKTDGRWRLETFPIPPAVQDYNQYVPKRSQKLLL